jgi:hypothetical protein
MHIMIRKTLFLAALLLSTGLHAASSDLSALPAGKMKVDVMSVATSERTSELNAKLRTAIESDREQWIADLQDKSQNGERLQWDERLGLTKEEHAELQRGAGGATRYIKSGEADLEFVRSQDGRVMLRSNSLPELAGIVIDPQNDVVATPFGTTTERSVIIGGGDQRWSGVEWKLEKEGETFGTGTTVRLAIGQSLDDGRGVLIYEAKHVVAGQRPVRESTVLSFPM